MARLTLEALHDRIAEALRVAVKSHTLPKVCVQLGLADGDPDEAFASKRLYVKSRIGGLDLEASLALAKKILEKYEDPSLSDAFSELTEHSRQRITQITRRKVLKLLDELDSPFGEIELFDGLAVLNPPLDQLANLDRFTSLAEEIERHWSRNRDWDNSELLEKCGALTCAQQRFFALIEKVLDPLARQGEEQTNLAKEISAVLAPDGFEVFVGHYISSIPVYLVRRAGNRPIGAFKNLIFASTGEKPEIILRDAINNDIQITKNAELCLVYERPIGSAGLLWITMAEWWKDQQKLQDIESARKSLGSRLLEAVKHANSPGEYAIFRTYYEVYVSKFGASLPALIPQVYLHFDPYTARSRSGSPILQRQRMDFLMLLRNGARVVIEVDGKSHYADGDIASPSKYAAMVAEDRRLRLSGYELYRFGGAEFPDASMNSNIGSISRANILGFFDQLFEIHSIA